ncbi:MAG: hypothetical protein KOO69_01245 [Victivallales bacterium]|nr:hypothetical protein [Victivallales bacterium]
MKRIILFAVVVVSVSVLVSGCTGINTPVTGTMPGTVFTDTACGVYVSPPVRPLVEEYKVIRQDVVGSSTSTGWLWVVSTGNSTYEASYKDALKHLPEADDLIDIKVDVTKKGLFMFGVQTIMTVRGTAIKYTGKKRR